MTKQATFRINKIVGIGTKNGDDSCYVKDHAFITIWLYGIDIGKNGAKSEESSSVGEER